MIDTAVDVAFFFRHNRSLIPRKGNRGLPLLKKAVSDQVKVEADGIVVNSAMMVSFLRFTDSALEPGLG
ncbi:hypothetical protein PPSIR1_38274 [Plesiocystis pacifica SIR-1]|uniref:Uncharacterized protein n=1 Tax=Plesiocystis pacifica SIR-1 TaxID=391625 RepID=A6GBT4_9BACT|nr:hypothetical protein PPSIR1_38274 [Plesiocystis pacifica SIR-1]